MYTTHTQTRTNTHTHIMKIFERVIKKEIMKHLTENELFNKGQHGFVPGRSMQTQLLSHFNDIFYTLAKGKRLDTVYLDFAKAFDNRGGSRGGVWGVQTPPSS